MWVRWWRPARSAADLLKVGHMPVLVNRVAVEAAAHVVIHAAGRHPLQRCLSHAQSIPPAPCMASQFHKIPRPASQEEARRTKSKSGVELHAEDNAR